MLIFGGVPIYSFEHAKPKHSMEALSVDPISALSPRSSPPAACAWCKQHRIGSPKRVANCEKKDDKDDDDDDDDGDDDDLMMMMMI